MSKREKVAPVTSISEIKMIIDIKDVTIKYLEKIKKTDPLIKSH